MNPGSVNSKSNCWGCNAELTALIDTWSSGDKKVGFKDYEEGGCLVNTAGFIEVPTLGIKGEPEIRLKLESF